jgi:LPS O-antigen subunit length determinant protein (WzzB/FepE family)
VRALARIAVTLYPAAWRERYGDELRALVEDSRPGWASVFDLLRGALRMRARGLAFAKLAAVLAVGGAVAGLGISFLVTPKYESTTVGEVRLTNVEENGPGPRQRLVEFLEQIKAETTSRQALSALIQDPKLDLYDTERKSLPLEDVEDIMRDSMKVLIAPMNPRKGGAAPVMFSVRFAYPDRNKAQAVVNAWVSRMIESGLLKAIVGVNAGDRALLERIARLQERIDSLERHFGVVSTEPVDLTQTSPVGRVIEILNPANLPEKPIFPNRGMFMATGCGAGFILALLATIYRRRYTPGAPQQAS